jgi:F420-non-reducing hydrogenase iron-sulfur subunit
VSEWIRWPLRRPSSVISRPSSGLPVAASVSEWIGDLPPNIASELAPTKSACLLGASSLRASNLFRIVELSACGLGTDFELCHNSMTPSSPTAPIAAPAHTAWTPRIVAFFCNWCTYTAADLAGVSRLKYASNVRVIRLMCSGRVDPQFVIDALARGADGVLIGGCHPGDCHYVEGNYKMLRRFQLLQRMLHDMGIDEKRVRLEWISAAEGEKVKTVINEMTAQIKALGPLGIPQKFEDWDRELDQLEHAAQHAATPAEKEVAHV